MMTNKPLYCCSESDVSESNSMIKNARAIKIRPSSAAFIPSLLAQPEQSPMKEMMDDETFNTKHFEIELDQIDSDDLFQIPLTDFHSIEHQIGMPSLKRSPRSTMTNISTMSSLEEMSIIERIYSTNCYLLGADILFPGNVFKIYWDRFICILVLYTAFMIPFYGAFHSQIDFGFMVYVEAVLSCIFLMDIWLSFRTTFRCRNSGEYVEDSTAIRGHYLKHWFLCDLIASAPMFEVAVFLCAGRSLKVCLSFLRLLRLSKLFRSHCLFGVFGHGLMAKMVLVLLVSSHWSACTLHAINSEYVYLSAFYGALTFKEGMTSSMDEQMVNMAMFMVSVCAYSMIFGAVSLRMRISNHAESEDAKHMDRCQRYSESLGLSLDVRSRIEALNRFEKKQKYHGSISYLMRSCNFPNSMKYSILNKTLKPMLSENYAFRFVTDNILLYLAENISLSVSLPNEYMFKANDIMSKVYVVQQGLIRIFNGKTNESSTELCRLSTGAHFGELSFFEQDHDFLNGRNNFESKLSTLSAVSHTFSVLYTISYIDFKEILLINPKNYKLFRAIADSRNQQITQYDDQQLCQILTQRHNNIGIVSGVHFEEHVDSIMTFQS